jgi:adenylylsulfate reductase subunit A
VGLFTRKKTVFVESDILVIGGGMAGCGSTYESRYWGRDLKIVCVEKANIERSGAVAQGLYAINCYMGMQWDENQPEDHVRYARNDLMGLVREDLGYDIARHVDSTVHKFEEWGLPIMKDPETGRYLREGKWQIMIHGESFKPIVAEAARKAATEVYNRIMVTHLLMDKTKPNRVAGAVGFNVRNGNFYVFRSCVADPRRRQDDADGEPDRPHPLQGRLWSGRCLLPASQDLHRKRVWRRVRVQMV